MDFEKNSTEKKVDLAEKIDFERKIYCLRKEVCELRARIDFLEGKQHDSEAFN